jgi:glycosyltransferase involved in cell wall biosynthesis
VSVYHKEDSSYLQLALNSVINQTYPPSEIVLVKDGPLTSELNEVIDMFLTSHKGLFKIVENETNLGLGLSLAKGVLACSHEYIARMDADDICFPNRFEKQIPLLNQYDIVGCWVVLFENTVDNVVAIKHQPEKYDEIIKFAKRRSPLTHPCVTFRKTAVLKAGNYQHCYLYEDYPLWIRMIMDGANFYNIQEPLMHVRTSLEQAKRRGGIKYLKNEIMSFYSFYKMGFYSVSDLLINITIRLFLRIIPNNIRFFFLVRIWRKNKFNK